MPQETSPGRERDTALIALGANLESRFGDPKATLAAAVSSLSDAGIRIFAQSSYYVTPCFPKGNGPDYVNAAISVMFTGPSEDLLAILHNIEADFGRERDQRWGSRVVDLDLIAHGQRLLPDLVTFDRWRTLDLANQSQTAPSELILPHPRMQDRGFVLVPLAEIAPDWLHPVLNMSVQQMLNARPIDDLNEITRL